MQNETFQMQRRVFHDERTGREVWQLTDGDFECVAPYMDVCAWTPDDRYLVFTSNRSGSWQPYRLHLPSGEAMRLLPRDARGGYRSVALAPGSAEAFCQDGHTVVAVNIDTLQSRIAVDYTPRLGPPADRVNLKGHAGALNTAGTLVAIEALGEAARGVGGSVILVTPTDGHSASQVIHIERSDLGAGHVLICPGNDNIISFHGYPDRQNDPQGSEATRTAQWRIERDSGRVQPLVLMPPGFRATHSTWGASGNRFYFHRKTVPSWVPTALCSVDRAGGALRVHYETSDWKLGHSATSPREDWIVTDSQDTDENILLLVGLQGQGQQMLCWPNMSQKTSTRPHRRRPDLPPHTDTDTHPGFSATGAFVHYTSDISGRSQIYAVPVHDLVSPEPGQL